MVLNNERLRGGATEVDGLREPRGPEKEHGRFGAPSGATEVDGHRRAGRENEGGLEGSEHRGGATEADVTRVPVPGRGPSEQGRSAREAAREPQPPEDLALENERVIPHF